MSHSKILERWKKPTGNQKDRYTIKDLPKLDEWPWANILNLSGPQEDSAGGEAARTYKAVLELMLS